METCSLEGDVLLPTEPAFEKQALVDTYVMLSRVQRTVLVLKLLIHWPYFSEIKLRVSAIFDGRFVDEVRHSLDEFKPVPEDYLEKGRSLHQPVSRPVLPFVWFLYNALQQQQAKINSKFSRRWVPFSELRMLVQLTRNSAADGHASLSRHGNAKKFIVKVSVKKLKLLRGKLTVIAPRDALNSNRGGLAGMMLESMQNRLQDVGVILSLQSCASEQLSVKTSLQSSSLEEANTTDILITRTFTI